MHHIDKTIKKLRQVVAPAIGVLLWSTASLASDAKVLTDTIDIETMLDQKNFPTKTLFRAKHDDDQFYYLPANLRFAKDKDNRPMFTVYKYNLVYNNGNFVDLVEDEEKGNVYQGGTLKATLTMGLMGDELSILENKLIEKGISSNPKIGRLPLNKASFSVELTDPQSPDGAKVLLGPFTAPVTADIIAVQQPLSKSATDIFHTILTKKSEDGKTVSVPDAPINVLLSFDYDGYGLDSKISVTGKWDNVYKASESKMEVKGDYWFVSGSASYEDKKSELLQDANIEVTTDGQEIAPEVKELVYGEIVDRILTSAFDLGGLEPAPEDSLDPDAGSAPDGNGGTIFGRPVGVSVGFAMKAVSKKKKGDITFSDKALSRVNREDARYAVLDISNADPERNILEVNPSDWSVARVKAEIAGDLAPFFVEQTDGDIRPQRVAMTYGTDVSRETFPQQITPGGDEIDFGPFPNGGDPNVEVKWTLPFAPWKQLEEELDLADSKTAKGSWSAVQKTMKKIYADKGPPAYSLKGDLRLMSGISLTASMLPVVPELAGLTIEVIGPEEGVDWDKRSNNVVLQIHQEVAGVKNPMKLNLGRLPLDDSYVISEDPMQAIILTGPDVVSSKLVASSVGFSDEDGKRIRKRNVVIDEDLQDGGFVTVDLCAIFSEEEPCQFN